MPTSKDTAILTSAPASAAYGVAVAAGESVAVDTLDMAAVTAGAGPIALTINGAMTLNTLEYDPNTLVGSHLLVGSGATLTVNKAITNTAGIGETIDLAGGTLNVGNKNTDLSSLTVNFDNVANGVLNFAYKGLNSVSTNITGFTFGDRIIVSNANLTGDTYKYDGSVLTVKNAGNKVLSVNLQGVPQATQFTLSGSSITAVVCFAEGTHIATSHGEERVENLRVGDLVTTALGTEPIARPIKWIGHRSLNLAAHPQPAKVAPIRIQANAFADQVPHRDLLVSPDHAIFVDGKLVCARQLVNNMTIAQETGLAAVRYYHIELESHDILLAEGLSAESYLNTGNDGFFANAGTAMILHPDLASEANHPTREAGSVAPFVWAEPDVLPIWQTLAARAVARGNLQPRLEQTTEADIRLEANGRRLLPIRSQAGTSVFVIPAATSCVRLLSRAVTPTAAKPWLEDSRSLGIYVKRITLQDPSSHAVREIPLDHPGLSDGWYDVERDGIALCRWTNGDAVIPVPETGAPLLLSVQADHGGLAYVTGVRQLAA